MSEVRPLLQINFILDVESHVESVSSLGEKFPGFTAKVALVDEGTEVMVDMCGLRPIAEQFTKEPAQSRMCLLSGVQPLGLSTSPDKFCFGKLGLIAAKINVFLFVHLKF